MAKKFLEKHAGNAEAAIDDLVSNGGLFQDDVEMADSDENGKIIQDFLLSLYFVSFP